VPEFESRSGVLASLRTCATFSTKQKPAPTESASELMTALFDESGSGLVGIEKPENHIHPAAIASFAQYLKEARARVQGMVTTHSPLLLGSPDVPESVSVVRRTDEGTAIEREANPGAVRAALEASGFGLGEYHATKGFGH
jgi:hypothetical protein